MPILDIVKYPDPRLKEACEEVTDFDDELATLLDNMVETMYDADGVGLAAPQIGVLKRITVIDVSEEQQKAWEFINPKITASEGKISYEEGCLSIPDYREKVDRFTDVTVSAFDRHGKAFEVEADELFSICLQHEIDHLDGVLFIDRLSRLKKELFKRWFKKNAPL